MKPITKIKRLIQKQLTAKETYEISEYARQLSYEKRKQEQIQEIKAVGVGNRVLVRGGSTELARLGIGAKTGTILSYGPKRVKVLIKDCERPGAWRLPYSDLCPPTEKNIKEQTKLLELSRATIPVLKKINKIAKEELGW